MNQITLTSSRREAGELILEAQLRGPRGERRINFQVPPAVAEKYDITERADPFVLAFCFLFMSDGLPVKIRGTVSAVLLRNLEEYMRIWQAWRPGKYRAVNIEAEEEVNDSDSELERP